MLPPIQPNNRVGVPQPCLQYKKYYYESRNQEPYIQHLKKLREYLCKDDSSKNSDPYPGFSGRPTAPVKHTHSLWECPDKENSDLFPKNTPIKKRKSSNKIKTETSQDKYRQQQESSILLQAREKVKLSDILTRNEGTKEIRLKLSSKLKLNKLI